MRDAQLWQQAGDLFEQLLTLPTSQRSAFLNQLGCERPTLLQQVRQILALYDGDDSFLTEEPLRLEALAERFCLAPEQRLGPYRIVAELGRGGMATVYLAERADQQFDKRVAIKVVRTPAHELLRRFRTERQILATLDHPRIARLIDAGQSEQGLPYLVMDYIEGLPIDRYCQQKHLGIRARLELFLGVCEAVQHAHRKLVVHRDLKPSNILVNAEGEASLLDFGIARLLQPEAISPAEGSAMTRTQVRALTPRYASPEQIRGEVVSTASDVYSLGVLLYELLSGQPPYAQSESTAQLEQWICQKEPVAPSRVVGERRLQRQLRGDLDTIVLMALRKEPERRYGSVERLAEDIRRHLAGLPVTARKDTLTYRTDKFIRRHRVGVVAGMLVAVAVGVGVVSTAEQARVAEGRFADVRNLANAFLFEFDEAIRDVPGTTQARQLLVSKALEYLDRLGRQSGGDRTLQAEIAAAYEKVGEVQGAPYNPNLGDVAGAIRNYRRAVAIREQLAKAEPGNPQIQQKLATSLGKLSQALLYVDNAEESLSNQRRLVGILEPLHEANPDNARIREELLNSYKEISAGLLMVNSPLEAMKYNSKNLALAKLWSEKSPADRKAQVAFALANFQMGELVGGFAYSNMGDYRKALPYYRRYYESYTKLNRAEPNNIRFRGNLAVGCDRLGAVLFRLGNLPQTQFYFKQSLVIRQKLAAADPKDVSTQFSLRVSNEQLAETYAAQGDDKQALEFYRQGLEISRRLVKIDPKNIPFVIALIDSYGDVARYEAELGRVREAIKHYEEAQPYRRRAVEPMPSDLSQGLPLMEFYRTSSFALVKADRLDEALANLRKGLAFYERQKAAESENLMLKRLTYSFYTPLAQVLTQLALAPGRPAEQRTADRQEARAWYGRAVESYQRLQKSTSLEWEEKLALQKARRGLARPRQV